ncbi:MAG TPA: response regulator [Gammaproteobacteria bacterium]
MTEQFHGCFELPREHERRLPDVVFVDADNTASLTAWDDFRSGANPTAIPIFVSNTVQGRLGEHQVTRPLILRKLMEVLSAVKGSYSCESTSDASPVSAATPGLRVLVVDDSLPVRTYMHQKLTELCGGRVVVDFAENGEAATVQVTKRDYSLVFLDVMMPGMDGYKTCKWIKSRKPTYVVLLTSRGSPFDKLRGTMSGCDTYLVKPPQDDDLRRVIAGRVKELESVGEIPLGWLEAASM